MAKLDSPGLITRRHSKADNWVHEGVITAKGKEVTTAIDTARERLATKLFARWNKREIRDLARLMRRFADDLESLPLSG